MNENHSPLSSADEFYLALGRYVTGWGDIDTALDLLILASKPKLPRLPHQLTEKINLLRKTLLPKLADAPELRAHLDELERLALSRNDYIHGSIIGFNVVDAVLTVKFARLLQPHRKPRRPPADTTTAELRAITKRIDYIYHDLLDTAQSVNRGVTQ